MTTITVRIAKLGVDVDFTVEQLPPSSMIYAWTYGLTQSINDAAASIVRNKFDSDEAFAEAVREKTDKRVEQILSGNVPGARAPADPNAAKARALAREMAGDAELAAEIEKLIAKRKRAA